MKLVIGFTLTNKSVARIYDKLENEERWHELFIKNSELSRKIRNGILVCKEEEHAYFSKLIYEIAMQPDKK